MLKYSQKVIYWDDLKKGNLKKKRQEKKRNKHTVSNSREERV